MIKIKNTAVFWDFTLKMEAVKSSETWRHNLEDHHLNLNRHGNPKSPKRTFSCVCREASPKYEGVSKSFRTESITK